MSPTIILISGANQGIGYQIALNLAKREGYHVIIGSRKVEAGEAAIAKIKAEGAKSTLETVQLDITSDDSIKKAVETVEKKHGKLDVLVNNAGVTIEWQEKPKMRELFERTYQVNVFGTSVLSETALPLLEKSEFPRIINVSSTLGSIKFQLTPDTGYPVEFLMVYNTSKSALSSLTAHYSLKLKKKPGRVVSLCPGYNSTANTNYAEGAQDPAIGAAGVVNAIIAPADSEKYQTGSFWNDKGEHVEW